MYPYRLSGGHFFFHFFKNRHFYSFFCLSFFFFLVSAKVNVCVQSQGPWGIYGLHQNIFHYWLSNNTQFWPKCLRCSFCLKPDVSFQNYRSLNKHLKELRNYNRKLWKHDQDSKLIFQNKFTLWHIRLNIYIWKTKFSSHKHYLFGLLFFRNAKKTCTDQSILLFYSDFFIYHGYNLLRLMFFIPRDNWKIIFLIQSYRYPEVWCNCHVAALFETSILKKVSILYLSFPQ